MRENLPATMPASISSCHFPESHLLSNHRLHSFRGLEKRFDSLSKGRESRMISALPRLASWATLVLLQRVSVCGCGFGRHGCA